MEDLTDWKRDSWCEIVKQPEKVDQVSSNSLSFIDFKMAFDSVHGDSV